MGAQGVGVLGTQRLFDGRQQVHEKVAGHDDVILLPHLFVPPLGKPIVQARSHSRVDRRDLLFPNRNYAKPNNWGQLLTQHRARMVVVDIKNYTQEIGKEQVNHFAAYLNEAVGGFGLIVSTTEPNHAAQIRQIAAFREGKFLLFVTFEHVREMLYMKERGDEPSDLIMDIADRFYADWE
jgi:hypothetical protein